MSVRETSLQSYDQLKASGKLSELEQRVTHVLQRITSSGAQAFRTRREVADYLSMQASTISGVVNRLIKSGAVIEAGTTVCKITNREVNRLALVRDPEVGEKDGEVVRVQGVAYVAEQAISQLSCVGCSGRAADGIITDLCSALPACGKSEQYPRGVIFIRKE